jgi:MoxR-like ATPase
MPIPELDSAVDAVPGFNVIATANNADKGVNELSSALKRRFAVVVLPPPKTLEEEVAIVVKRVGETASSLSLPAIAPAHDEIARVVRIFRELREGRSEDNKHDLKKPSSSLSTAEAISVGVSAWADAAHFGDGRMDARGIAGGIVGAVVKDPTQDTPVLREYLDAVTRRRAGWSDVDRAIRELI